ncbi:hypothetical protein RSAG8_04283, partial [Rhizoctonia solani AG-8 WAC10335]
MAKRMTSANQELGYCHCELNVLLHLPTLDLTPSWSWSLLDSAYLAGNASVVEKRGGS